MEEIKITQLTKDKFDEAVKLVLDADLDTKEEIEHHLEHIEAHYIATINGKIIGVIGWYQDNVNYATDAMGDKFPGPEVYWVGFFAVGKNYRNRGIGTRLLNKLESVIREKDAQEIWVSSVPETKDYYEKHGFKFVSTGEINSNPKFFLKKTIFT